MAKTTKKPVDPAKEVVSHTFYGGRVTLEAKPWGDHFRFTKVMNGVRQTGILSATGVTKWLDKPALIGWAVGLVGTHVTSTIQESKSLKFTKEEIYLVVADAIRKPEEAKIAGGKTGDVIHDFAHAFAKAELYGQAHPEIPAMADLPQEEKDKALNGINAFLDWFNNNEVEFLAMEKLVYYNSFFAGDTKEGEEVIEFLGLMDCLARVNGKILVLDYKTGKKVYTDQRYQLSGYWKAWNGNPDNANLFADGSEVLNFSKETGDLAPLYISPEESEKDFKAFRGLHAVALREKELLAESKEKKA